MVGRVEGPLWSARLAADLGSLPGHPVKGPHGLDGSFSCSPLSESLWGHQILVGPGSEHSASSSGAGGEARSRQCQWQQEECGLDHRRAQSTGCREEPLSPTEKSGNVTPSVRGLGQHLVQGPASGLRVKHRPFPVPAQVPQGERTVSRERTVPCPFPIQTGFFS